MDNKIEIASETLMNANANATIIAGQLVLGTIEPEIALKQLNFVQEEIEHALCDIQDLNNSAICKKAKIVSNNINKAITYAHTKMSNRQLA